MHWKFRGTNLSLIATLHVLDADGVSFTAAIEQDYKIVTRVVFECDLDAVPDPALFTLCAGIMLETLVPEPLWCMVQQAWTEAGLELSELSRLQPWMAAMKLQTTHSAGKGFTDVFGVDRYVWNRSAADQNARVTLESLPDVFQTFNAIPLVEQLRMLAAASDPQRASEDIARMVKAWRENDGAIFEAVLEQRMTMCPVGFKALLEGRNRSWLPDLLRMAGDGVPTLAVVGALHCFGSHGLPALLENAGLTPIQVYF